MQAAAPNEFPPAYGQDATTLSMLCGLDRSFAFQRILRSGHGPAAPPLTSLPPLLLASPIEILPGTHAAHAESGHEA